MSGLARYFSNGPKPLQTVGAMANYGTRGYTTPARNPAGFRSPGVSEHAMGIHPAGRISQAFMRTTQAVPFVQASRRRVGTPVAANRGHRVAHSNFMQSGTGNKALITPRPSNSLISRMALSAVAVAVSPDRRNNRKSVDKTRFEFKRRFSGASTEDWMAHVNALELDRAKKKWLDSGRLFLCAQGYFVRGGPGGIGFAAD